MAGVVAALEAHDDVGLFRQPVDDLALPFVTPLGADDDNISHFRSPILKLQEISGTALPDARSPSRPHLLRAPATPQGRPPGTPSDKGRGPLRQARTGVFGLTKRSSSH